MAVIAQKIRKPTKKLLDSEANALVKLFAVFAEQIGAKAKRLKDLINSGDPDAMIALNYINALQNAYKKQFKTLLSDVDEWEKDAFPRIYQAGQKDGVLDLKKAGVLDADVKPAFQGNFHKRALELLADELYTNKNMQATVGRRYDGIFRQMGLEVASGVIAGHDTWQQAMRKELRKFDEFGENSFTEIGGGYDGKHFIDAGGHKWGLRSYSEMVARTVTMHVMNVGKLNEFLEYDEDLVIVSAFEHMTHKGTERQSPCPLCIPWEGKILSISGKTKGYPSYAEAEEAGLFHPMCLTGDAIVSGPKFLAHDSRWYEGKMIVLETSGGNKLSITPNHPILTSKGWVPAGHLNVGDKIVQYIGDQSKIFTRDPDNIEIPTLIKDVGSSLFKTGNVSAISVPISSEDFHGDGTNGKVNVIYSDGLLTHKRDIFIREQLSKSLFMDTIDFAFIFNRFSFFGDMFRRLMCSTDSGMSSFSKFSAFIGSHSGKPDSHRLASIVSGHNSGFSEPFMYSHLCNSKTHGDGLFCFSGIIPPDNFFGVKRKSFSSARCSVDNGSETAKFYSSVTANIINSVDTYFKDGCDLINRLSGKIELFNIVKIDVREFLGHVYNLQTEQGWYIANGIITHNCKHSFTLALDELHHDELVAQNTDPTKVTRRRKTKVEPEPVVIPPVVEPVKPPEPVEPITKLPELTFAERVDAAYKDAKGAEYQKLQAAGKVISEEMEKESPWFFGDDAIEVSNTIEAWHVTNDSIKSKSSSTTTGISPNQMFLQTLEKELAGYGVDLTKGAPERFRDVFRKTFDNIRTMGGNFDPQIRAGKKESKEGREKLQKAADYIPAEWIKTANNEKMWVRDLTQSEIKDGRRTHYDDTKKEIVTEKDDAIDTLFHEFHHFVEYNRKKVHSAVIHWRDIRTIGEKVEKLKDVTGLNYRDDEVTKKDKFFSPYIGKQYNSFGASEVFSTGMQHIYRGGEILKDRDMLELMLGVVAKL